ncbi:MAG TPA: hypothetical protein PLV87_06970 [Opitutaceae bacterium]|nr:hypothetical protein [Opitutaceae bacterium]
MRQFQNNVLDYKWEVSGDYTSAHMETAWATEAMFFVRVEQAHGKDFRFNARAQISVNGIDWIDEGTAFEPIKGDGQYVIRLKHFGGWLRITGGLSGENPTAIITTNLVLKE